MLRIFHNTHYDFIRWWKWAVGITAAFLLVGLLSFIQKPINYSLEFTGGTLVEAEFTTAPDVGEIRSLLTASGLPGVEIQQFGSPREFTIRAQNAQNVSEQAAGAGLVGRRIESILKTKYGEGVRVVPGVAIGPRVGAELSRNALIALLISFVITLIYLAIRYHRRFGFAAVVATAHDFIGTLAFIKLMDLEVSLMIVAGLLTVIGYSMNDTVVIFDRVRENQHQNPSESLYDRLNRSINETLPRSIITHATSLSSVLALLIFGGEVIRPFAWVMGFGILTGTFSSMYVAAPILIWIDKKWPRKPTATRTSSTATRTSATRPSTATATR